MILFLGNGFIAKSFSALLDDKKLQHRIISNDITDEGPDRIKADIASLTPDHKVLSDVDTVVYFAHSSVPYTSMLDIAKDAEQNILVAIKLFEIFAEKGTRVIYISSGGSIYGNQNGITTEDNLPAPISAYGLSKYTVENYLKLFHHNYQLPYDILRLSNIYGVGQKHLKPQGIVSALAQAFMHKNVFTIWGDGNARKDYLYVDDLAEALLRVVCRTASNDTYNISFGQSNSISEIIAIFEEKFGHSIEIEKRTPYNFDVQNVLLDNSKFIKDYDWKPEIDIETGIAKTISWFKTVE